MQITKTSPCAMSGSDLSISYGAAPVVQEVSVELTPGQVTALVGPNGSGKSTVLRGMSRLQHLTTGSLALDGAADAAALSARDFARQVTLLAQSRPTPAGITVRDAVEFGRHPHRRGWRGGDPGGAAAIERALALTGMSDLAGVDVDELSGGQVQRVWFASALAQDTAVLMLDEPTNHLDLRYQIEVLELIRDLADQHAVAIGVVLHDLNQAATLADRVLVLSQGRVVADGDPQSALRGDLLSEVYEIEIDVLLDPATEELDIRSPRQRLTRRARRRTGEQLTPTSV